MIGSHLITTWSSTQAAISLSSGEAEFCGVVKASGIGLGYEALMEDLGWRFDSRIWTDSIATIGICGRAGLGKLRHIDTRALWLQNNYFANGHPKWSDARFELVNFQLDHMGFLEGTSQGTPPEPESERAAS